MTHGSRLKTQDYKLAHPGGSGGHKIELAIFEHHRYSFYYWLKWTRSLGDEAPPALVTIDWHRDLAPPLKEDRESLEQIPTADLSEVSRYTEANLDLHNDAQVLSAAWLNLVGDIILLKNYGMNQEEGFTDRNGETHRIFEFEDFGEFCSKILDKPDPRLYLDIDLDYFIKNKVAPHQQEEVELYSDEEIREVIDPENDLFRHLFERLNGITIATEPRYCGGVRNSVHILKVLLDQFFTPGMKWRHLE